MKIFGQILATLFKIENKKELMAQYTRTHPTQLVFFPFIPNAFQSASAIYNNFIESDKNSI
jgi:hypothetical protein